uniref:Uncharacterized protein n=1 Tax=Bruguiera gymnorhiza TaxID=39984 RepID=B1Q4U2_BRUGY|nr:hypothetical protein [Bruguiera gymnorhiza]
MARLQQSRSFKPLLFSFLIVALSTLSSARVLNDHLPHKESTTELAATETVLNIVLPGDGIVERSSATMWEKDSKNVCRATWRNLM